MPKASRKGGLVIAGLGFGIAAGTALGALVVGPNLNGGDAGEGGLREEHRRVLQSTQIIEAQSKTGDSVISDLSGDLVQGTLDARPVMIIAAPDAVESDIKAVKSLLEQTGAVNAGTINLDQSFFHQDGAEELKSLVANTLPAGAQLSTQDPASGTHAGNALGAALLLDPETAEPLASVEERADMLQALRDSGFIDYESGTILPAQAIIVVSGRGGDEFFNDNLLRFVEAMDAAGGNTVYAARIEQASEGGVIDSLRAKTSEISTVDSLGNAWARLAAVLATEEQLNGGSGAYGAASSAEAAAPTLPDRG